MLNSRLAEGFARTTTSRSCCSLLCILMAIGLLTSNSLSARRTVWSPMYSTTSVSVATASRGTLS